MDRRKKAGMILFIISGILLTVYFPISILQLTVIHPLFRVGLFSTVCILCYIGVRIYEKALGRSRVREIRKRAFALFFALYMLLVLNFTLADNFYKRDRRTDEFIFQLTEEERQEYYKDHLQKEPLNTVKKYIDGYRDGRVKTETLMRNLAGNVILLMPLALFLPLLFDKQKNFFLFAVTSAFISALIEALQLILMIGVCDMDDLILNTLGALLSFVILSLPPIKWVIKKIAF